VVKTKTKKKLRRTNDLNDYAMVVGRAYHNR
jgi:hypothetical protein